MQDNPPPSDPCESDWTEPVLSKETEACMRDYRPDRCLINSENFAQTNAFVSVGRGLLEGLANIAGLGAFVDQRMPINTAMVDCWNKATEEMQKAVSSRLDACREKIKTDQYQYLQEFSTYLHSVSGLDIARLKTSVATNTFMIVMLFVFFLVLFVYILTMRAT